MRYLSCCLLALTFLVVCVGSTGLFAQPRSSFPKLTAAQKEDIDKTLKTAQECFAAGDVQRAGHLITLAANIDPSISPAMTLLAKWAVAFGRQDVARKLLDDAVDAYPNDPEALFLLADIARMEERRTEATLLLARGQEVLEQFKESPIRKAAIEKSLWSNLANLYEMKGNLDNALSCLERLETLEEANAGTQLRFGMLYHKRNKEGDREKAIKAFEKAFEIDPSQLPPKVMQAQFAIQKGEKDEADKLLSEALAEYPDHVGLLSFMATTQMSRGRYEDAKKTAEILEKKFPDSPEVAKLQGMLALNERKLDVAETYFRKALEKTTDAKAIEWLAMILFEKGGEKNIAEASALMEASLRQTPSQEGAVLLAWGFFLQGKKDTAERLIDQVLDGGPVSSNSAYYAAMILADLGKTELAMKLVKATLDAKTPFFKKEDAEQLLKKLGDAGKPGA